jgi:hypothetical protein
MRCAFFCGRRLRPGPVLSPLHRILAQGGEGTRWRTGLCSSPPVSTAIIRDPADCRRSAATPSRDGRRQATVGWAATTTFLPRSCCAAEEQKVSSDVLYKYWSRLISAAQKEGHLPAVLFRWQTCQAAGTSTDSAPRRGGSLCSTCDPGSQRVDDC